MRNDHPSFACAGERDAVANIKLKLHVTSHILLGDALYSGPTHKLPSTLKNNHKKQSIDRKLVNLKLSDVGAIFHDVCEERSRDYSALGSHDCVLNPTLDFL